MRNAVSTARLREGARREALYAATSRSGKLSDKDDEAPAEGTSLRVDWVESLYLATAGGKTALGLGGTFDVGSEFDAQQSKFVARRE